MGDLTDNFSRSEFACKCGCGADAISLDLVERLQLLRRKVILFKESLHGTVDGKTIGGRKTKLLAQQGVGFRNSPGEGIGWDQKNCESRICFHNGIFSGMILIVMIW